MDRAPAALFLAMPEQRVSKGFGNTCAEGNRLDEGRTRRIAAHQVDVALLAEAVVLEQTPERRGVEDPVDAEIRIVFDPLPDDVVADHERQALCRAVKRPLVGDAFDRLIGETELFEDLAVDVPQAAAQPVEIALELHADLFRWHRIATDRDRRGVAALKEAVIPDAPDREG